MKIKRCIDCGGDVSTATTKRCWMHYFKKHIGLANLLKEINNEKQNAKH